MVKQLDARFSITGARIVMPTTAMAAAIHCVGGRIQAQPADGACTVDLRDHLLIPGLINAHDHLHLNNIPPVPHTTSFASSYAWIAAMPAHLAGAAGAAAAVPRPLRLWQGALKNLLAGVTTVQHHDPWEPLFAEPDFPVHVPQRYGWCHSLGLAPDTHDPTSALPIYGPAVRASYRATPAGAPWIMHLAEGVDAGARAELDLLAQLGCLGPQSRLVHAVGLSAAQQERALACGAGLIWCPSSNLVMLGATLDPQRAYAADRLALATDARLTGARDLLDELRIAAQQSSLPPAALFRLSTTTPARLLGLDDVGALTPGCRADLFVLADPGGDPYPTLLDAQRSAIRAVVRAGRPALVDPDLGDWMAACGGTPTPIRIDGRPKLIDKALLGPPGVAELEPGLETEL